MKSTLSIERSFAFVLSENQIQKLAGILQGETEGGVLLTADCSDGVAREFPDVQSLLNYENSEQKQIQKLSLRCKLANGFLQVRFSEILGITIDGSGEDELLCKLRERVLEVVGGTRTWYSAFSSNVIGLSFLCSTLVTWIFVAVACGQALSGHFLGFKVIFSSNEFRNLFLLLLGGASAAISISFMAITQKLLKRTFPLAQYLIGQGQNRHAFLEKVHWSIIVGMAISIAAGLITAAVLAVAPLATIIN